ncbi:MAG: bifunctional glutamate N-acetyltransferase/amino-acid acetyltransferase ArgJ [Verrucomicrobia bacterium]|nr:bifunctional glutamate N-acetyltransferase/amino-acid acetyltransferase ArgJ [Verrucomicrobiota bacterium]MCH8513888.1 bifunctional glutamate N-acetyltransferase/amino-acid acetyltransferase ArgJ [Kiritimatiellia bacterium]
MTPPSQPAPEYQSILKLPKGFRAAGVHAGIKADAAKFDMAMIVSDPPETVAAGMFTTNKIQAEPVRLGIERLKNGRARAVVVNSGNANACTGPQGERDAVEMGRLAAEALQMPEEEVLVSSTGTIGKPLDLGPIRRGVPALVSALSAEGGDAAASGILTTDTRPKVCTTHITLAGKPVTLSGFCKGAGMIEPNMATMLAYVCTDAALTPEALRTALRTAVNQSFNRISIDGDTSTNDSVIVFANGAAENPVLTEADPEFALFQTAMNGLLFDLAMKIVWDGEGMTKFIELRALGAANDAEADKALRAVATSFLVKTGWAGTYPVWGRIVDVLGYCGVEVDPNRIAMWYDELPVMREGMSAFPDKADLEKIIKGNRYTITMDLGTGGSGSAVLYTCDCTEEYVRINMF